MEGLAVRYKIAEHVQLTVIDGTAILLDGRGGKYLGLNEVATRILQLVGENRAIGDVLDTLLEEYEAPEAQVRDDVEATVQKLEIRGIIERQQS